MAVGYLTNQGAARIISGGSLRAGITHIALYHADPGTSGTSHANEISSSSAGYARQPITWTNTGGITETNTNVVTFTAAGNWAGSPTHWGYVTNGTRASGVILMKGPLDATRSMTAGRQIRFDIGELTIQGLTS